MTEGSTRFGRGKKLQILFYFFEFQMTHLNFGQTTNNFSYKHVPNLTHTFNVSVPQFLYL